MIYPEPLALRASPPTHTNTRVYWEVEAHSLQACLCAGSASAQAGASVGLKLTPPCSVFMTPFHGVDAFVSICVLNHEPAVQGVRLKERQPILQR